MVERRNRSNGEAFLGCSRYPTCKGTRELPATAGHTMHARTRSGRPKLSLGGRPSGFPDYAELVVVRIVGRNLSKPEGCLVQAIALIAVLALVYWIFTSGLYLAIVKAIADWYAHQITVPGAPTPTVTPSG
jgi:hypothetical protein